MKTKLFYLLIFLPALFFGQNNLVRWNSNADSGKAPNILVANVGASSVSSASGITNITFNSWGNNNSHLNFSPITTAGTLQSDYYVQYQISANSGYKIDLDKFSYVAWSEAGSIKYQVRYSKDASFVSGVTTVINETSLSPSETTINVNLNGVTVYPTETLYLRIYVYGKNSGWNSGFRVKRSASGQGTSSNIGPLFTGTVSAFSNVMTAVNDAFIAQPNQTTALNVLANDIAGGAAINAVSLTTAPAHGTAVWNTATQRFDYTPNTNYFGGDSFTYTINNGVNPSSTATVTLSVQGTTPTGNLSGTYYIDSQYGHFATITSAVNYLNTHTVTAPVTFILNNNTYNNSTGEVFPIEFTSNNAHLVTFKPGVNKNVNIDAYNANSWTPVRAVFKFNGAAKITFDGSNNGSDSKNLTINNYCNILNGSDRTIIWLSNQTNNLTFENLTLMQGSYNSNSSMSCSIYAGSNSTINTDTSGAAANPASNITITNNLFKGVKQGVFFNNSNNNFSTNITVSNNDFGTEAGVDKITHSVFLRGVQGFNVSENIIYDLEIEFSAGLDYSGIYVGGNSRNGIISKNKILGIYRNNNAQQVSGIHLATTYSSNSNIALVNNFISDVYSPGSNNNLSGGAYGIYLHGGKGYKIYHNTVSLSENVTDGVCAAIIFRGTANQYSEIDMRNNIFKNNQTNGNYASGIRKFAIAFEFALTSNLSNIFTHLDNNNYYAPANGGFIAGHTSLNTGTTYPTHFYTTFTAWKDFSAAAFDANSGTDNTTFVNNYNLHVTNSNAWVNNNGVGLASEFAALGLPYDDIDGQLRSSSTPDIGADEFGVPAPEPGVCETVLYWNGSSWGDINGNPVVENGEIITEPTSNFVTEIRGAYNTELHGSFTTCQLTIATGGSLRIKANDYVYIVRRLINNLTASAVVVDNNGSIIQELDINENVGNITYKRSSMAMFRYDYTYWGSPVTGQTTAAFSPNSGNYRYRWDATIIPSPSVPGFYEQARWKLHNGVMLPGHGYIIKAPNSFPNSPSATPQIFNGSFVGVPNSGPYTIETVGDINDMLPGGENQNPITGYPRDTYAWNFFSNPYPSAIDVKKFRDANNMILDYNVYLWTHNTKPILSGIYLAYSANDFAVYNIALGQGTAADPYENVGGQINPNPNVNVPTKFIASGQGFFMAAKQGSVQFNNSMRVSNTNNPHGVIPNNQFYRQNTQVSTESTANDEKHILKLSIRNNEGAFHQTMIGYIASASNGLDNVDGALFGGNYVSIYTLVENAAQVVQGRALPFEDTDEIQVGYSATMAGNFSINLDYFDGIFSPDNANQAIYIKDHYLNTLHNLKDAPYEFYSEIGSFNERFSIVYKNALSTGNIEADLNWGVVTKNNKIEVYANGFTINNLEIYDITGRQIYNKKDLNTNFHTINNLYANQILIVKITTDSNKTSVKKFKN